MDLAPTPAEVAFRSDIRSWLIEHLPWKYGEALPPRFDDLADEVSFGRQWQASLAADRWVGVTWPEEYGGRGAGPTEHFIVQEELSRAGAPEMVGRIGINLAGPTLLTHGTEQQKARWLPGILSAEDLWCQLFSEPGAGSDLASVTTRATEGRRRVGPGRPEGLDLLCAVRRLGGLPGPLRSRRPEASRYLLSGRRHARHRHRGPPPRPAHR